MYFCAVFLLLCSYIIAIEGDKGAEAQATASNLVATNPDVQNKSELTERSEESPAESDLFEKINHVVDEFNTYRNNFLMGNKRGDDNITE